MKDTITSTINPAFSLTLLIFVTLLCTPGYAQGTQQPNLHFLQNSSPVVFQSEDDLVRRAYFKVQMYQKAGNKYSAKEARRQHNRHDDLDISIYNIQTGPIQEIYGRKFFDLITGPGGENIQFTRQVTSNNKDRTEYVTFEAKWVTGRYMPPNDLTVEQTLRAAGPNYDDIEKYTTYEVHVRMSGKERLYKAMALYHTPAQSTRETKIEFFDMVMGEGGFINKAFGESRPPMETDNERPGRGRQSLIKNDYQYDLSNVIRRNDQDGQRRQLTDSAIAAISNNLVSDNRGNLNYFHTSPYTCDSSGICCPLGAYSLAQCCRDPNYIWHSYLPVCSSYGGNSWDSPYFPTEDPGIYEGPGDNDQGSGGNDSEEGNCLAYTYYANPVSHPDSNDSGHLTGSHGGSSSIQSYCEVNSFCNATCKANILDVEQYENGVVWTTIWHFWHASSSIEKRVETATGYVHGNNTPPTCATAVGFAVKSCWAGIFCNVGVTISGGPLGLSVNSNSEALLTYAHTTIHTCPKIN